MTKPIVQKELSALIEAAIETDSDYLALKDGLLFMPVRSFRNKGIFDLDFGLASIGSPISSIFSDVARRSAGADEADRHFSSASTKVQMKLPNAFKITPPAALSSSSSVVGKQESADAFDGPKEIHVHTVSSQSELSGGETSLSTPSTSDDSGEGSGGAVSQASAPGDFGTLGNQPVPGDSKADYIDYRNNPLDSGDTWVFHGNDGNDTIIGSAKADIIYGDNHDDVLTGWAGNDTIYGGGGFDTVDYSIEEGGSGITLRINYPSGSFAIDTWGHTDTFGDTGDSYIQRFIGSRWADHLSVISYGGRGYQLAGGGGSDTLEGFNGNGNGAFTLDGGAGADSLVGGVGDDFLYGSRGGLDSFAIDTLRGGAGNDYLEGNSEDLLIGEKGNDTLVGGHVRYDMERSSIYGDPDAARVIDLQAGTSTSATDSDTLINVTRVTTGAGNDQIRAAAIGSRIFAGAGNDTIYGGAGSDYLDGGSGANVFHGSSGWDTIVGSRADGMADWLTYQALGERVVVDVTAGRTTKDSGTDQFSEITHIEGTNFNDSIKGDGVANVLVGGRGHDTIWGGQGNDSLYGGDGNDVLLGEAGADYMEGGAGDDVYWIDGDDTIVEAAGGGTDTVMAWGSFSLANIANVEHLTVLGSNAAELTGNGLNNRLVGNDGDNTLRGGAGADTMIGGNGNDVYYITDLSDVPVEYNGTSGGFDSAYISVQYFDARKLANIEHVYLAEGIVLNQSASAPVVIGGPLAVNGRVTLDNVAEIRSTDDGIGGPLYYEMVNNPGGAFEITTEVDGNGVTYGRIGMIDALLYEHIVDGEDGFVEINGRKYAEIQVRAVESDTVIGGGASEKISTIHVEIVDVNYAPNAPLFSGQTTSITVGENASSSIAGLWAYEPEGERVSFVFDADRGDAASAGGLFEIVGGTLRVKEGRTLDYESLPNGQKYYSIWVRAQDPHGALSPARELRVNVTDANDAPTLQAVTGGVIKETLANEGEVAELFASDQDGDSVSFTFANGTLISGDGAFRIVGTKIVVANREAIQVGPEGDDRDYQIILSDGRGGTSTATITIQILNDMVPSNILLDTDTVAESLGVGEVVGTLSATDEEPAALTYSFVNGFDGAGHFEIDNVTKQIKVKTALNYEDQIVTEPGTGLEQDASGNRFYRLKVMVTDDANQSSTVQEILVYITDANEAPTDAIFDVVPSIGERSPLGTPVAELERVDDPDFPGPNQDFRFSLVRSETDPAPYSGPFSIDALTGQITVSGTLPDVRVPTQMKLYVRIADHGDIDGHSIIRAVTFTIDPAPNTAPTISAPDASFTISDDENVNLVTPFAGVTIADPDNGDTITVTVTALGEYGGAFVLGDQHFYGTHTLTGSLQDVLGRLRALKFDPTDRPDAPYGSQDVTAFQIEVDDGEGGYASLLTNIFVTSVRRAAPDVSANGQIEWTTPDNLTVPAFKHLVFTDLDTNPETGLVTVTINYDPGTGGLDNFIEGITYTYDEIEGFYSVEGTLQQVNKAVRALQFEPHNRPSGSDPVTTEFSVRIIDGDNLEDRIVVTVHSTSNDAPIFQAMSGGSILENHQVGAEVAELFATDPEGDSITFTFANGTAFSDDGAFQIVGTKIILVNQEAIQVGPDGAYFDYDIVISDAHGASSFAPITIRVDNADRAPTNIRLDQPQHIPEDWGAGLYVGQLLATDPDGDAITGFSLLDPTVPFEIRQSGQSWYLVISGPLDYEDNYDPITGTSYYNVQVTATAGGLTSAAQTVRVYISDVGPPENTAPVIMVNGPVNWTVDDDTVVDPFKHLSFFDAEDGANDDDPDTWIEVQIYFQIGQGEFVNLPDMAGFPGATLTYTAGDSQLFVRGTAEQVTAIVQSLHFHTSSRPDDPDGVSEMTSFQVFVLDTRGAMAIREVTVDSVSVDGAPHTIRLDNNTVAESLGVDQVVGTLSATDENPAGLSYAFVSGFDGGGRFGIDNVTKQIKVLAALDYEGADLDEDAGGKFYLLKVTASDGVNTSAPQEIKVYVTDVNEAPTAVVVGDLATIRVGAAAGMLVVDVDAVDPDTVNEAFQDNVFKFRWSDGSLHDASEDGFFTIDADGKVKLAADVTADQLGSSHSFTVVAHMAGDPSQIASSQEHTVTVLDGQGDPGPLPDLLENKTILEHSSVGVAVGRLMSSNPATGETFTYELATDGDAGGRFMLDGNVLRVANSTLLDFEQQRLWDVKLIVTNSLRGQLEQTFTISLRNADTEFVEGGDNGDMFVSGAGADGLFGHGGNDTLVSGEGFDELWGGAGADAFVIDVYVEDGSSFDMIMDFDASEDRIELAADYFFTLALGSLDDSSFYILGNGDQTEQHQIMYDETTGELFYDMDGSGTDVTPILIAILQNGSGNVPVLSAANFLVVNNYWTA